jgi:hypothetical protein
MDGPPDPIKGAPMLIPDETAPAPAFAAAVWAAAQDAHSAAHAIMTFKFTILQRSINKNSTTIRLLLAEQIALALPTLAIRYDELDNACATRFAWSRGSIPDQRLRRTLTPLPMERRITRPYAAREDLLLKNAGSGYLGIR